MRGYDHATFLKTFHLYKQATHVSAYECMFTMAATEERCPAEGGLDKGGLTVLRKELDSCRGTVENEKKDPLSL